MDDKNVPHYKRRDRAAEVAGTFEWLITAFVLAFVFRAFVMEAFRIPTGSMADTLKGAHFSLRCPQCGCKYEHGYVPQMYGFPQDTIPPGDVQLPQTRCPSCGYYRNADRFSITKMPVANGDRILVLKCVYQFLEPRRWDVVVFKNPLNPGENYIKRLIGLPGETIEIMDGDVYINGQIARKPDAVQDELWMLVYDNDFQPVNTDLRAFNGQRWESPFDFGQSKWTINQDSPTQLFLDSPAEQINTLTYGKLSANDFRTCYAYNDVRMLGRMPQCSDLMVRFYSQVHGPQGSIGAGLSKYGTDYKAWVDFTGKMTIVKDSDGQKSVLAEAEIGPLLPDKLTLFKFASVDHELILQFGNTRISHDIGRLPQAMGTDRSSPPRAEIFGSGKVTLSHLAVFRDIHYTGELPNSARPARAIEGSPFTLNPDEFFVLGDNSPNSEDGRWWDQPDVASRGFSPPRAGVVPRDYLVGKALFVYWPSGFAFPWPENLKSFLLEKGARNPLVRVLNAVVSLRWIPNVGQMRFVYGGCRTRLGEAPSRSRTDQ